MVDGDQLGEAFNVKAFHRCQVLQLLKHQLIPADISSDAFLQEVEEEDPTELDEMISLSPPPKKKRRAFKLWSDCTVNIYTTIYIYIYIFWYYFFICDNIGVEIYCQWAIEDVKNESSHYFFQIIIISIITNKRTAGGWVGKEKTISSV